MPFECSSSEERGFWHTSKEQAGRVTASHGSDFCKGFYAICSMVAKGRKMTRVAGRLKPRVTMLYRREIFAFSASKMSKAIAWKIARWRAPESGTHTRKITKKKSGFCLIQRIKGSSLDITTSSSYV